MGEASPYKAIYGGRGSAKSWTAARVLVGMGWHRPIRWLCGREIQKSIRESVKQLLDDQIHQFKMHDFYRSLDTEIRGANGTQFIFTGLRSNPETVRSLEGLDGAWLEEANTISKRSLTILDPTLRKKGSELWATWNPRFPTDPIDEMFRKGTPPPGSIVKEVHYYDNPWFKYTDLPEKMEYTKSRDLDAYAHIWLGGYLKNSEARVFKNWTVEEFDTPPGCTFYYGADWGFSVDPSVLLRCFKVGRKIYFDRESYQVGCPIDGLPTLFDKIDPDKDGKGHARKWVINADSARPETIDYMRRHGYPRIKGALKGPGSVEDGIEFLQSYDLVVHPRFCPHLVDELTMFSWKMDPLTDQILPILEDKNNHVIDSARYAVEGVRRSSYHLRNVG